MYELCGDDSFNLTELAAEVSKASGKTVVYKNLPEEEYQGVLMGFGLPTPVASMLAESDIGASQGELESKSKDLSRVLGRPTTTLTAAVAEAIGTR